MRRESASTRHHRRLIAALSSGELDVLMLSCRGMSAKEAADARGTLTATVRTQRRKVVQKLGVSTLIEAAVIAAKAGIV